ANENASHYSSRMPADLRPLACAQPGRAGSPIAPKSTEQRRISSVELLGRQGEILIDHQQQVYRLRITSLGKLILTK
ncbi:hemin uptake protein HemP, partial [Acinetobacter baumannii]